MEIYGPGYYTYLAFIVTFILIIPLQARDEVENAKNNTIISDSVMSNDIEADSQETESTKKETMKLIIESTNETIKTTTLENRIPEFIQQNNPNTQPIKLQAYTTEATKTEKQSDKPATSEKQTTESVNSYYKITQINYKNYSTKKAEEQKTQNTKLVSEKEQTTQPTLTSRTKIPTATETDATANPTRSSYQTTGTTTKVERNHTTTESTLKVEQKHSTTNTLNIIPQSYYFMRATNKKKYMKYILQWTSDMLPMQAMNISIGQKSFIDRKCAYVNCFFTNNKWYFENYTMFDAVVFFLRDFHFYQKSALRFTIPKYRCPHQKYALASPASSDIDEHIVRAKSFNSFFNWTWTYKLDSDLVWSPFIVKDVLGNIIAPKKNVKWMKQNDMYPVSESLKKSLASKTKSIIWLDTCTITSTSHYVIAFIRKLKHEHGIYTGKCRSLHCNVADHSENYYSENCMDMIKNDYRFYLAFEETMSTDFVSSKALIAIINKAVPIVFGGANYTRFLPDGSYLDATVEDVDTIAAKIHESALNFSKYLEYFKWTNHYTFHEANENPETDEVCKMCALMNDQDKIRKTTIYENFSGWWGSSQNSMKIKQMKIDPNKYIHDPKKFSDCNESPTKKELWTAKNIMRKSATAFTSFIDYVVGEVKNLWNTIRIA